MRVPASHRLQHLLCGFLAVLLCPHLYAQVHYRDNGSPWNQQAKAGPDKDVPGWFYNLGVTGMRVRLLPDAPRHLLVEYVFEDTPAHGTIKV